MTLFTSTARSLYQDCLDERRVFWVTDPGHGWLAVPLSEVNRLGIGPRISPYSYIGSDLHGYSGYALLEEDCDAALYLDAVYHYNLAGLPDFPEFTFDQPRNNSSNVAHNVRALDSYSTRR